MHKKIEPIVKVLKDSKGRRDRCVSHNLGPAL